MKKLILFSALFYFSIVSLSAQEALVSKKGVPVLPEKGEYMIGIDASPFFSFFGNMFNGNLLNQGPAFGFTANAPLSLYGKYMVDEKKAYRIIFRLGQTNTSEKKYITKDEQTNPDVVVEDVHKIRAFNLTLGAGIEKRRGKGRLQGLYGAQMLLSFGMHKDIYSYGNSYSATNTNPHRSLFGSNYYNGGWVLIYKGLLV